MEKLDALCADACVGSLISVTSKSEIRYEGELFTLDTEKSTVVLKDVRSFGTEGRRTNNLHIPSSSVVYEYIIFRNTDIKDLSVVTFSSISKKSIGAAQEVPSLSEKVSDHLNGRSLDICLGWPVSPHSAQIQTAPGWWQWPCPIAPSTNYGISSNSFLACLPTLENKTAPMCSWREEQDAPESSSQAKLFFFEQVPHLIARTQLSAVSQDSSSSKQGFSERHIKPPFSSSQACLSWQQPLLPLPLSDSQNQHRKLTKKCKGFTSHEHARKPKVGLRARQQTSICEKESTPSISSEVTHSVNLDISKEFDFAMMNGQFNKKEVWNEIELNKMEGMKPNENQRHLSETFQNAKTTSCSLSRKAQYVDDFFDLSLSDKGIFEEKRLKGPNKGKQSQIDAETFGATLLPKKKHRPRRGLSWGGQHIPIKTK